MSGRGTIRVGVIGLGFMGRTHLAAYEAARRDGYPCEVVAVCDREEARRTGKAAGIGGNLDTGASDASPPFDPGRVRAFADPLLLLEDPSVDLVSVCTPTGSHVDLGLRALAAGKHVLVEKPVALRASEAERLAGAALASDRLCMPAMCMRFWPGWTWLRESIRSGAHGRVLGAVFQRLGSVPAWSREFYGDPEACGGVLFDLHVHDADFVRWCFGEPEAVATAGSDLHVTTLYHYAEGQGPSLATAEGAWDQDPGIPFRMRFTVSFEEATAEFDLERKPPLVLTRGGRREPVPLPPGTGYDGEVRHLLEVAASGGRRSLALTIQDAVATTRLLEAELRSLETRTTLRLKGPNA
jgi:predicted dehydrogenase